MMKKLLLLRTSELFTKINHDLNENIEINEGFRSHVHMNLI